MCGGLFCEDQRPKTGCRATSGERVEECTTRYNRSRKPGTIGVEFFERVRDATQGDASAVRLIGSNGVVIIVVNRRVVAGAMFLLSRVGERAQHEKASRPNRFVETV